MLLIWSPRDLPLIHNLGDVSRQLIKNQLSNENADSSYIFGDSFVVWTSLLIKAKLALDSAAMVCGVGVA
jgi:hypothetical protein